MMLKCEQSQQMYYECRNKAISYDTGYVALKHFTGRWNRVDI